MMNNSVTIKICPIIRINWLKLIFRLFEMLMDLIQMEEMRSECASVNVNFDLKLDYILVK